MPQLDPEFFVSQLFWLVVVFATLYFLMSKLVLPRISEVLEERQDKVDDDLARAEKLRIEAEAVLTEYEEALAVAREEAAGVLKQATDEMKAQAAEQQSAFSRKLAEQSKEAEDRILAAKTEALGNLKSVAAEAAVAATAKLIGVTPGEGDVSKAVDTSMEGQG
jgi:F-type H+-transporting ATPase subunit b